ncbi:MAG: acyl--CoA ligase, partial [Acidobacteriota bacterium]|nr:acyl--CoA ligase [Acidobacteriota bacterium]
MQNQSFCQRLIEAANQRPTQVAMMLLGTGGSETTTFGLMLSQIRSLAYRLSLEQIAFGDRVAIIGENHPNWAIAYLGIMYRGAVVVPLDPSATAETLATFLRDSETKLAFVSEASLEKFRAVSESLDHPVRVISLQPPAPANGAA